MHFVHAFVTQGYGNVNKRKLMLIYKLIEMSKCVILESYWKCKPYMPIIQILYGTSSLAFSDVKPADQAKYVLSQYLRSRMPVTLFVEDKQKLEA